MDRLQMAARVLEASLLETIAKGAFGKESETVGPLFATLLAKNLASHHD